MNIEWVCLRGLGRGNFHWGEFRVLFDEAHAQEKIHWLEYPGNGERFAEKSPLVIDEYVHDLRAQLRPQPDSKYKILAISFGGMVALRWAELFPNEIQEMILINTSHKGHAFTKRLQPRAWKHFIAMGKASLRGGKDLFAKVEKEILKMTVNNQAQRQRYLPASIAYAEGHPVTLKNLLAQLFAARNAKFNSPPKVKIGIITSKKDHMVSTHCSEKIARDWGLPIKYHPWGGHDLPLDDAQGLMQLLKEF